MNSSATTIPQSTSASLNKWPAFAADEATKRDSIASTLANDDFINLEPRRVPIVGGGSSCTSTSAGYTDNALALVAGSSLTKVDYSSATATSFGTPPHTTPNTDRLVLADRFKTKLCRAFERKEVCQYGYNCMFAHSEEEKRTVEMNMKDELFTQEAIDEFRLNQRMRVAERAQKALQLKQKSVGIHLPHVTLGDIATETTRKLSGPAPAYRPPQQPPLLHGISSWPLSVPSHAVPISTTPMITQSYPISYDVPPPTSHQPGHQTVVGCMPMTTALAQPRHGPSNLPLQAIPQNLAYTTVVYATVPVMVEPPLSKRKRKARLQEQQVRQELWEEQQQQLLKQYKQQLTPPIEVTLLTDVDGRTGLWRGMGETDQITDFGPNVPPTTGLLHLVADNMSPQGSPEPPHPNHTHRREVTVDNEIIESFGNSVVQQVVDSPTFGDVPQTRRQKKQQRLKEQLRQEQQQNPHTVSPFPHSAYMATTQQFPVYVVPAQATGQQQITPQMLSYQTPTLFFNPDVVHATNRPTGPTHYQLAYPQVPATVNPAGLLPHHPIATLQFPLSGAVAPYQYLQ